MEKTIGIAPIKAIYEETKQKRRKIIINGEI